MPGEALPFSRNIFNNLVTMYRVSTQCYQNSVLALPLLGNEILESHEKSSVHQKLSGKTSLLALKGFNTARVIGITIVID